MQQSTFHHRRQQLCCAPLNSPWGTDDHCRNAATTVAAGTAVVASTAAVPYSDPLLRNWSGGYYEPPAGIHHILSNIKITAPDMQPFFADTGPLLFYLTSLRYKVARRLVPTDVWAQLTAAEAAVTHELEVSVEDMRPMKCADAAFMYVARLTGGYGRDPSADYECDELRCTFFVLRRFIRDWANQILSESGIDLQILETTLHQHMQFINQIVATLRPSDKPPNTLSPIEAVIFATAVDHLQILMWSLRSARQDDRANVVIGAIEIMSHYDQIFNFLKSNIKCNSSLYDYLAAHHFPIREVLTYSVPQVQHYISQPINSQIRMSPVQVNQLDTLPSSTDLQFTPPEPSQQVNDDSLFSQSAGGEENEVAFIRHQPATDNDNTRAHCSMRPIEVSDV